MKMRQPVPPVSSGYLVDGVLFAMADVDRTWTAYGLAYSLLHSTARRQEL